MSLHWNNDKRQVCNKVARKYSPEHNSPLRVHGSKYRKSPPTIVSNSNTDDHTKSTISSLTMSKDKDTSQQVTVVNLTQNIHLRKVVLPNKTKVVRKLAVDKNETSRKKIKNKLSDKEKMKILKKKQKQRQKRKERQKGIVKKS